MTLLRLKPWHFGENEVVELCWICSPYYTSQGNWKLKAVFLRQTHEIFIEEYPWGTLPYLILGQKFENGLPSGSSRTGINGIVQIADTSQGRLCSGFDMPKDLYSLHKNSKLGSQKLWHFTVADKEYYIPCIEIVRSFLAHNKTMANTLMSPNGLDLLVDYAKITESKMTLELSDQIPASILCDDVVIHIAWLYLSARNTWDSVYNKIFRQSVNNNASLPVKELSYGLPISLRPPTIQDTRWTYRGIENDKSVLILELISMNGMKLPFTEIEYSHPSIKERRKVEDIKKIKLTNKLRNDSKNELDDSEETVKKDTMQNKVGSTKTSLVFDELPEVKKKPLLTQDTASGSDVSLNEGRGGASVPEKSLVGTDESIIGGKISPIEFTGLEVVSSCVVEGFEHFSRAIEYIRRTNRDITISMTTDKLPPPIKKFSYLPGGQFRECAVMIAEHMSHLSCCVLEIARPDDWAVSTLFIKPRETVSLRQIKDLVSLLLDNLVLNGGHWDKRMFEHSLFEFEKLKHVKNQTPERWGERILRKLS